MSDKDSSNYKHFLFAISFSLVVILNVDTLVPAVSRAIFNSKFSSKCEIPSPAESETLVDEEAHQVLNGIPEKMWPIILNGPDRQNRANRSECIRNLMAEAERYPIKNGDSWQSDISANPWTLAILPLLGFATLFGLSAVAAVLSLRRMFAFYPALGRCAVVLGVLAIPAHLVAIGSLSGAYRGATLFVPVMFIALELVALLIAGRIVQWIIKGK